MSDNDDTRNNKDTEARYQLVNMVFEHYSLKIKQIFGKIAHNPALKPSDSLCIIGNILKDELAGFCSVLSEIDNMAARDNIQNNVTAKFRQDILDIVNNKGKAD